jgi:hypothetical protein
MLRPLCYEAASLNPEDDSVQTVGRYRKVFMRRPEMKMLKALSIAIILFLLMTQAASAQAPQWKTADYDAARDFSIQSNPNGVWSYGWESSLGSALDLYTVTDTTSVQGMSFWSAYLNSLPYVAHNDTDKQNCWQTVCIPPSYLQLHPGPIGELSVLRWTAPSSGTFQMQIEFVGLDWAGPTSTYVHVLLNSKRSLLKAPITSYQLPLSFPRALLLSAGDTLDFIVDWGKDGNYNSDSTGAEVKISKLGPH